MTDYIHYRHLNIAEPLKGKEIKKVTFTSSDCDPGTFLEFSFTDGTWLVLNFADGSDYIRLIFETDPSDYQSRVFDVVSKKGYWYDKDPRWVREDKWEGDL